MLKFKHKTLTFLSGFIWFVIGFSLLFFGLKLVTDATQQFSKDSHPFLHLLAPLFNGHENAAVVLIAGGLILGYFKGRFALKNSAQRVVKRILSMPNPCSIFKMYGIAYYLLILSMILIGVSFNYFGVPKDIRGTIDIAIGAALMNGAFIYFRLGMGLNKEPLM